MNDDRPGIKERLSRAYHSTDLKHYADRPGDVDKLQAVAMASSGGRIAGDLLRLKYDNDRTCYEPALRKLAAAFRGMAIRKRWRGRPCCFRRAAEAVLRYWMAPNCPACTGRRYKPILGQPTRLSDDVCDRCRGVGSLPLEAPIGLDPEVWLPRMHELRAWLDAREAEAADSVMRRLSNAMQTPHS